MEAFRRDAPPGVPESYIDFLAAQGAAQLDVPGVGSGLVWFWELSEVLELNRGYAFDTFAPGLFGFGSDGAGALYVFDLRNPSHVTVGDVDAIPLDVDHFRVLADSFEDFATMLARGTPA